MPLGRASVVWSTTRPCVLLVLATLELRLDVLHCAPQIREHQSGVTVASLRSFTSKASCSIRMGPPFAGIRHWRRQHFLCTTVSGALGYCSDLNENLLIFV